MKKNRINVYGVINSVDFEWMRGYVSPTSATFPADIAEALSDADPSQDLELHIDSPGGYIDAGRSMISMIQEWCDTHNRKCNVTIGGLAASMAAVMSIAFGGKITVRECSLVMFHAAKVSLWDDATAEELRDTASSLDVFNRYAAKMIARRAGITEEEAAKMIEGRKESFFGADDLIANHLADEIAGAPADEPVVQLPPAAAMLNFAKTASARNDAGGLLAAVAVATLGNSTNKGATMPKKKKAKASAAPVNEETTTTAPEEETTVETPETTEEETTETTPSTTDEESTTETEKEPVEEETTDEEEETTETEEESEEVKNLRADVARLQADLQAALDRATAAEKSLKDEKAKIVRRAMTPPPENNATKPATNVHTEWRELVHACGGNTAVAKAKRPDLFAAITQK